LSVANCVDEPAHTLIDCVFTSEHPGLLIVIWPPTAPAGITAAIIESLTTENEALTLLLNLTALALRKPLPLI
jgi:hypothetical protein